MSNWILLTIVGVLAIIAGILALLNPFPASLAAVRLASWAFLFLGGLQIFEAFRAETWGGKLWTLLLGVVAVIVGINLLGRPLEELQVHVERRRADGRRQVRDRNGNG